VGRWRVDGAEECRANVRDGLWGLVGRLGGGRTVQRDWCWWGCFGGGGGMGGWGVGMWEGIIEKSEAGGKVGWVCVSL